VYFYKLGLVRNIVCANGLSVYQTIFLLYGVECNLLLRRNLNLRDGENKVIHRYAAKDIGSEK
jgi:hypothetical protein